MMTNLKGLRVLNTRPKKQAQGLSQAIKEAQGIAIECPALSIKPKKTTWLNDLPDLSTIDIAIFISTNAVHYCFKAIASWPASIQVIAVGDATAKALTHHGIQATLIPKIADSEHLIQLGELQAVNGKRILLFKGEDGRTLIADTLIARGAHLYSFAIYKRQLPKHNPQFLDSLWQNDSVDIILITSQEAMRNLFTLLGEKAQAWLCHTPWLVISERLAKEAALFGIQKILVSNPKTIINTLHQFNIGSLMATQIEVPPQNPEEKPEFATRQSTPAISLMLAIIALLAASYAIYTNYHFKQTTQALKQQEKAHEDNLDKLREEFNRSQTGLQTQLKVLDKNLELTKKESLYQKQDWLLLKARYLIEMSQINAHWSDNPSTSLALLKQADALIATLSDQRFFALRQALAKDIATLQSIPKVDVAGLLSKLDAIQSELINLPIKPPVVMNTDTQANNPATTWRESLKNSVTTLGKLVIIRHHDEAIQPILSPLDQKLMRDSIQLNLQEAQWAVLQKNPKVYQLTLKQAIETIKRIYKEASVPTQAILHQLQSLQTVSLITPRAPINESLPLLNQLIEEEKGGKNE